MSNSPPSLDFDLRPWSALTEFEDAWAALADRTETPNIFFHPAFALPAARALGVENVLRAALFWQGQGDNRRLVGFVPLISRRRWLVTPVNLEVWTHPYGPASLPLAEPGVTEAMGQALVRGLAGTRGLPRIVMMPQLLLDSAFAMELLGAGAPLFVHGGHQKPVAVCDLDGDGYLAHALRSGRRNRLKRQRKQLEKIAPVGFALISDPAQLPDALGRFVALESRGWKGMSGTALERDAVGGRLFEGVTGALTALGRLKVAELRLGDQPIASLTILCGPRHYWFWKITFDETYKAQSPGRMLLVEAVRTVLNETPGAVIDSCAAEADHFSGHVLRERVAMGDVLLSTRPRPNIIFRTANLLEVGRGRLRKIKARLKR